MSISLASDPEILTRRLAELIKHGRSTAAHPLIAAVRRLSPPSPRLTELSARLAIEDGRLDDALAELDAALATAPAEIGLLKCRADVRVRQGDFAGAAIDAADAVMADRHDTAAKAVLGMCLLELGRHDDAVACLGEALAEQTGNEAVRIGLATAQERSGDSPGAEATLAAGIERAPGFAHFRRAAILLQVRQQRFTAALAVAEAARLAGAVDASVLGLMGHCLSSLGRNDEAAELYAEALKLGPNDAYVRHLVAASGRTAPTRRASVDYVRTVFDGYASRFEAHLISLGYRGPGLIRAALLAHLPASAAPFGPVLDLGCGTGLLAVAVSDLPIAEIVGVDASGKMLEAAAAKRLYADLHEADLVQFLDACTREWAVILAGDVMCYFGALDGLLGQIASRLRPGGLCVFTLEALAADDVAAGQGWHLHPTGRYAHALAYVEQVAAAAGLHTRTVTPEVLRQEPDRQVAGWLVVLERPAEQA